MNKTLIAVAALTLLSQGCVGVGDMGGLGEYGCIDWLPCATDTIREELIEEGELDEEASADDFLQQVREGGCFVTGIGHIGDEDNHPGAGRADQDSFGGNAMGMRDGRVRGQWQNTTHLGDLFHGSADWLRCWNDGGPGPEVPRAEPNVAQWGGEGRWNHEPGYRFVIYAEDRAEGGSHVDYYSIPILDPSGTAIYSEGDLIDGGNFQIHPPNGGHPYEPLPAPPDADDMVPEM